MPELYELALPPELLPTTAQFEQLWRVHPPQFDPLRSSRLPRSQQAFEFDYRFADPRRRQLLPPLTAQYDDDTGKNANGRSGFDRRTRSKFGGMPKVKHSSSRNDPAGCSGPTHRSEIVSKPFTGQRWPQDMSSS
jgi:hypothetical protein